MRKPMLLLALVVAVFTAGCPDPSTFTPSLGTPADVDRMTSEEARAFDTLRQASSGSLRGEAAYDAVVAWKDDISQLRNGLNALGTAGGDLALETRLRGAIDGILGRDEVNVRVPSWREAEARQAASDVAIALGQIRGFYRGRFHGEPGGHVALGIAVDTGIADMHDDCVMQFNLYGVRTGQGSCGLMASDACGHQTNSICLAARLAGESRHCFNQSLTELGWMQRTVAFCSMGGPVLR